MPPSSTTFTRVALLGDAVNGELGVGVEVGERPIELPIDFNARDASERRGQLGERADEPELLEHLGAQLARDATDLIESPTDRLFCLADLVTLSGSALGDRAEVQQDAGEHLPHLVVQVASDADALGFLGGEDAPAALSALPLEPVEHMVEGDHDAADLVPAQDLETLTGTKQVDPLHSLCKALQRGERASQEDGVGDHGHHQRPHDHEGLRRPDRSIDLDRTEQKQRGENAEQPGVDREHTPEDRKRTPHQSRVRR